MRKATVLGAVAAYLGTGAGVIVFAGRKIGRPVSPAMVATSAITWPAAIAWAAVTVVRSPAVASAFADERNHGAVRTGPIGTTAINSLLDEMEAAEPRPGGWAAPTETLYRLDVDEIASRFGES